MGKKIKSIAVILFAAILTLNSVTSEASRLGAINPNEEVEVFTGVYIGDEIAHPKGPVDPGIGHNFKAGRNEVTVTPTCTRKGTMLIYCAVKGCNIHKPRESTLAFDPNNHEGREQNFNVEPTCETPGKKGLYCPACKMDSRITIDKLGHDHSRFVHKDPTSTSEGYDGYACTRCGHINFKNIISRTDTSNPYIPIDNPGGKSSEPSNEPKRKNDPTTADKLNGIPTGEQTGDPIDVYTGAHVIEFSVLSDGNLTVGLSYRSNKTIRGDFGNGFYWNYESFVEEKNGEILLYHSPAKYVVYRKQAGDSVYRTQTQGSEFDELTKKPDGTITLVSYGKTFDYDKKGKLCNVTEKTGEAVLISYIGKEIILTDSVSDRTIKLTKNSKGLVEKVVNEGTAEATFAYDEKGNLVKYTDVDGFETTYTYYEDNRVHTSVDADGNTCFEDFYNEAGRIEKQKDANGVESYFKYVEEKSGVVETTFTDREGNVQYYRFDEYGHCFCL